MKKFIIYFSILITTISCESSREKCIKHYVDEEGYTYEQACQECDEIAESNIQE